MSHWYFRLFFQPCFLVACFSFFAASGWLSKCFQARAICTDLVGSLALLWEKEEKREVRLVSTHSGSIWTVRCASSSTSPSCGQSHGPIASSIPLRAAQLLGGNASDPEAQSLGACPSRGKFTSRITRHGQSDDPRANVSSVGPFLRSEFQKLLEWPESRVRPVVTLLHNSTRNEVSGKCWRSAT